ncbi:hypothetical protein A6A05_18895 [Magnetospirillum moscoviense]|uniref:Uncharacterized protein n=2 Tax=Magnetospirillum moscoviense TaxID=1437059 RepID=A0A178MYQ8_9PROT|nr:hypothetical protein A6A05_18895 [Magnetospirillum moscoviense]
MDELDAALRHLGGVYDRAELSPRALARLAAIPKTAKAGLGRMANAALDRLRMPEGAALLSDHQLNAAIGGVGDVPLTGDAAQPETFATENQEPHEANKDEEK